MFYELTLFISLTAFIAGMIYRVSAWFRHRVEFESASHDKTDSGRISSAASGIFSTIFSSKFPALIQSLAKDVLVQMRILKEDKRRWAMHILIFSGFTFLFIFHALDRVIVTPIFDRFYLAINPFLIIAGLMVLWGIAIAVYRRYFLNIPGLKTRSGDLTALILLAVIILTGLAMELLKLSSYHYYTKIWYLHILACFVGLAWIPFGKMIHMFTTPLSLLSNAVMDEKSNPANVMTRQMMELSACMSCGTCSNRCSVAMAYHAIGNPTILPSERIRFLRDYFSDKSLSHEGLCAIQQGIYLCTNCDRCTVVCPAGINLRELWFRVREEMIRKNQAPLLLLTPFSHFRGLNSEKLHPDSYDRPLESVKSELTRDLKIMNQPEYTIELPAQRPSKKALHDLPEEAANYAFCFSCENCSTVCPVVGNYEEPQEHIDMMPHQIMRSLGLGIQELATGSRMLWYCLTCYQCQEHCPQGVKVTDLLYALKNRVAKGSPDKKISGNGVRIP